MLLLFHKPYRVLSQFTDPQGRATLAAYIQTPGLYPAGRLDYESEGLLLLTDDGALQQRLSDPRFEHPKTYYAQVEGDITAAALKNLLNGVALRVSPSHNRSIKSEQIFRAQHIVPLPQLPPEILPRPVRAYHPTPWLQITLTEGKKHIVRRLLAAVGLPVLRLVRWQMGSFTLSGLLPGEARSAAREGSKT
ncbi:MAG: rRNA large subunit pseudouridine synthase E [Anaerolineales bacterium]